MVITRLPAKLQEGDTMPRVSLRTLTLMLELLVAVLGLQYVALAGRVKADTVWRAADRVAHASAPAARVPGPATADITTRAL